MAVAGKVSATTLEERSVEDEWFKAIERPVEHEDLLKRYSVDLQKKEQEKVQEDYRRNRLEFRQLLET